MDSFDLDAAALKLNDGMARKPAGGVVDPNMDEEVDNTQLSLDGLGNPALAAIENIKRYLKDGNIRAAKHLYDRMKAMKLFNDTVTFESLSAGDNGAAE